MFGVSISGAIAQTGNPTSAEGYHPDKTVPLKLDSFLKQSIALSKGVLLSRHDVLLYVANKIGGVHVDGKPSGHLSHEKMHALGRLRRGIKMGLIDGTPTITLNIETLEEEHAPRFRYEPEFIDAVYLEFLACVETILTSPEIAALRCAIAADLKAAA